MDKIYDVLAIWRDRAAKLEGKGMPGGHNMQEGAPAEVLAEVQEVARANAYLTLEFTERGGHVGFVSGRVPWQPRYYAELRAGEFLADALDARAASLPMQATAPSRG